jgi:hypothetical protein
MEWEKGLEANKLLPENRKLPSKVKSFDLETSEFWSWLEPVFKIPFFKKTNWSKKSPELTKQSCFFR